MKRLAFAFALLAMTCVSPAYGQTPSPAPSRDQNWGAATTVTMASAGAIELLMPRVFYAEPEVTVGWKARWHVSQLAPVMTLAILTLGNEFILKPDVKGRRPGCNGTNDGVAHCDTFGEPSTHAFGSFAALGHGAAVWLFDMTKWSGGQFHAGAFAGHVAVPLVLAGVTAVGRGVGNWEGGDQIALGGALGLGMGFLMGMTYALLARPECGYTGNVICW
jgi:hypothetical protein